MGYRQVAVWLTLAERDALLAAMRAALENLLANESSRDRAQFLVSPVLFPIGAHPVVAPLVGINNSDSRLFEILGVDDG